MSYPTVLPNQDVTEYGQDIVIVLHLFLVVGDNNKKNGISIAPYNVLKYRGAKMEQRNTRIYTAS